MLIILKTSIRIIIQLQSTDNNEVQEEKSRFC